MKCKNTEVVYLLGRMRVKTFNAEEDNPYQEHKDVSWSHGFTHFIELESKNIRFCGYHWFEMHAKLEEET